MASDKHPRNENLNDLSAKPLDADEVEKVKGGAGPSIGSTSPIAPVLKPISPKLIVPCV